MCILIGLAWKAQSFQGWPISFLNCYVAEDFASSDNRKILEPMEIKIRWILINLL